MPNQYIDNKEEIFDPKKFECCIEIGGYRLENPPQELIDKLIGKPIRECEKIINEYLKPKEKLVVKWKRIIGFKIPNDNR